jgi:hypothetical protein
MDWLTGHQTLRVELLRFKRTFPNAKFSIGMDNHAFLVRYLLYVTMVGRFITLHFSHMEETTHHQDIGYMVMQCVILTFRVDCMANTFKTWDSVIYA